MKKTLAAIGTLVILVLITLVVYTKTTGYSVNVKDREITATGMIAVKSIPDGAQVYVNDLLTTATNGTIQNLKPDTYKLKVVRNGYQSWEKDVEVFEGLVTDITAVLVSKTPRLEPLTSSGARAPVISPSLTKVAYFTKDGDTPGVWVFPLGGSIQINLFKTSPGVVLEDTARTIFSNGESIEWSPDERQILVKMKENNFFLASLDQETFQATSSAELVRKEWQSEVSKKRELFLSRLSVPEELVQIAMDPNTLWSPDEKKFLYKERANGLINFKVHDLEKPLPVGEKTNYTTFSIKEGDTEPKVYWYSDSFHLILVEGDVAKEQKGSIHLIRIDGTNKTEIYNNTLYSDVAFSTVSGDKIVILTSFKSDGQSDLYAIGIR